MRTSLLRLALAGLLCVEVVGASMALTGCNTLQAVTGPPSANATNTVAAAETTYIATAKLATVYLKSGKATPGEAAAIAKADALVFDDLAAARAAIRRNDSPAMAVALNTIQKDLPAFAALIPGGGR